MLNQPDHQDFLTRQALSGQKGQRYQGIVIDKLFCRLRQQRRVAAQVPQEQKRAAALVAVGEWVIFYHKVEQMSGACGDVRVVEFIAEALFNGSKSRCQAIPA
ncbi:MAG: hypothetical protein V7760_11745 [Marinobacter sp.]